MAQDAVGLKFPLWQGENKTGGPKAAGLSILASGGPLSAPK